MISKNSQFLRMAMAHLEVGKVAANSDSEMKSTDDYQNILAYHLYHAIELFYKFMISEKGKSAPKIHDLKKLAKTYSCLYPEQTFKLDHPFDFSCHAPCKQNQGEEKMVKEHLKQFDPEYMDQHLRYPADKKTGGYSFSFDDSSMFEQTKNRMMELSELLRGH